ncbi:flavin-containing monooxygenase [Corynebacterium liangguodongii]|uniref:NAD(P)/FAD-dependent oxidoreductase n=1 Tax=Corynebacterium liangguodongii TaxID=2079535 RepID=A0A2S0WFE5_9CORY|nr:NAD(P)/FAD-dependent oxidoreductase [Corynebacterium liangguodongii]AWB84444.1 NAD(P)/FAD-dependent oxidoreductase [Corynebacterium liangguodongii]PWB99933.1 NAD(P)/FAD-dependent oxidoreductase [Corynebacterium liangguodongii]
MSETVRSEELQRKYAAERDKRKAARGSKEEDYVRLEKVIDPDAQDPYKAVEPREPLNDDVEVTIIGAGWAGLMSAAELRKSHRKIRILDQAGDFGGVWYWNRYPGVMCDTASVVYMPLLDETGYKPTEKYAHGPEIFAHAQRIGRHFDLYKDAYFHTRVTDLRWDEAAKRWRITTNRGDEFTSQFVSLGLGALNVPRLPSFEGMKDFKGDWFHTARWDYSVTGGNPEGAPLDKLHDKTVAIIGTGATAIQIVPELAKTAKKLLVIQRTPTAVDVRDNGPITYDWWDELTQQEGWQQIIYDNFLDLVEEYKVGNFPPEGTVDLLDDGWTNIGISFMEKIRSIEGELTPEKIKAATIEWDDEMQQRIRDRTDEEIADKKTADGLKAWYRRWCKRPGFHDEYLETFNRDNVELVDTDGQGVGRITENGVEVLGEEYPVDVIIYSTGFHYNRNASKDAFFDIVGRNGVVLRDKWKDGMLSYMGYFSRDFPNLFFQQSVQAAFLTSNVSQNYAEGSRALRAVVDHTLDAGKTTFEASQKAEEEWVHMIETEGEVADDPECTPGYYNNEGKEIGLEQKRSIGYPKGKKAFFDLVKDWRSQDELAGIEIA